MRMPDMFQMYKHVITLTAGRGPTLLSESPVSEFLPYPPQAVSTVAPKAATVTQKAEKDTTEPSPVGPTCKFSFAKAFRAEEAQVGCRELLHPRV